MPYKNPEDAKENRRKYYLKNRDKAVKKAVEWNRNNPDKRRKILKKWNNKESTKIYKRVWYEQKYFDGKTSIGRVCERCSSDGNGRMLDVHHKDKDKNNNLPENLQVLCRSCHTRLHALNGDLKKKKEVVPDVYKQE